MNDLTITELEARKVSILEAIADAREALTDPAYPSRFHAFAESMIAAGLSQVGKVRLEATMMGDEILLVSGTGPAETWQVLRVWHTSQREEAEQYLTEITGEKR